MKQIVINIIGVTSVIVGFLIGIYCENEKWERRVASWNCSDLNDFYIDSSWQWQGGHKIDIPEELLAAGMYNEDSLDLSATFLDDNGDIHILPTKLKYPTDSLILNQ